MDRTQQAASILAICASILLAGALIAYTPRLSRGAEFRFPVGIPPSLGASTSAGDVSSSDLKTLSLSGTGKVTAKASQATVAIGVYTEDRLAGTAIDENAGLMTDVIAAIKALGFTDEDIQTISYVVYPMYDWEAKQVISYQVTNMVQVKVLDLDKLGPVIDAAAAAGANKIESITFGLSDELANQLKLDAYVAAIADAESKANVITTNLGITITGIQSVSESSYYPYTPYRSYSTADAATSSTPILEGTLSVTVTLNIVYVIE
jgi:hypothetical protein